jgi:hypothetical protein
MSASTLAPGSTARVWVVEIFPLTVPRTVSGSSPLTSPSMTMPLLMTVLLIGFCVSCLAIPVDPSLHRGSVVVIAAFPRKLGPG